MTQCQTQAPLKSSFNWNSDDKSSARVLGISADPQEAMACTDCNSNVSVGWASRASGGFRSGTIRLHSFLAYRHVYTWHFSLLS